MRRSGRNIPLCLFLLGSLLLSSCLPGRRLARQFAVSQDKPAVLLIFPDFIYKHNLYTKDIVGYSRMTREEQDSAGFFSSQFLKNINDSAFLGDYYNTLRSELEAYGYTVFPGDRVDTFLKLSSSAYVFSLAQLVLEEDRVPYGDWVEYADTVIKFEGPELLELSLSNWFEVSRLNAPGEKNKVLFSSDNISEEISGLFRRNLFSGDVTYKYSQTSLNDEDAAMLAVVAGERNASRFLDYFMNEYAIREYKGLLPLEVHWHYDKEIKTVVLGDDFRFTVMDEEDLR